VELSPEPSGFSDLVGRRVCDQGGHPMGRVYEARAHWERDGSLVLDELLVGRNGLWRRLRGPGDEDRGIPWEAVIDLGGERIVVRV